MSYRRFLIILIIANCAIVIGLFTKLLLHTGGNITQAAFEQIRAAVKRRGLLLYSSTGCADGTDGDLVMFGPPFVIDEDELAEAVAVTADALGEALPP